MYRIYTTEGIVLELTPLGEANAVVTILTHECGLTRAHAQAVRREKSKLRGHVQLLARGSFSLVRGREHWRLVGAEAKLTLNGGAKIRERQMLARVFALVLRLVHGEEAQTQVFDISDNLYQTLSIQSLTLTELHLLEIVSTFRLLTVLGYADSTNFPWISLTTPLTHLLESATREEATLKNVVQTSLRATQL